MKLALESNLYLDKRGAIGKMDVEVSKARLDKAGAEAAALAARIRQCVVRAPFDGRIAGLTVNEHEIPANGKPFLEIVEERAFEIDLIVPSTWLRRIGAGTRFTFAIDETGRSYPAEVLRVGASVDPVSQTVKVIAGFVERDEKVLAGMSGTAEIAFPEPSQ
jgi:multidrug resistance efflux pump